MEDKRLGCLTISGIITAILTVLIVAGVALAQGGVLYSPGALNAQAGAPLGGYVSHADIGGKCAVCHTAFWERATMADRCVACHTDVAAQLQDPTSLHGVMMKSDPNQACRACHPEHRGADASLTATDASLPHDLFGYSLQAHQRLSNGSPFSCRDCHGANITRFDQAVCETCHNQIDTAFMQDHLAAYGNTCLTCHDGLDTYGKAFDHSRVPFPLTGAHVGMPCSKCHNGARSITDLQTAPQDCYSCHAAQDTHQGQFGQDCAACHSTSAWKPATLDHSKFIFPLTGAHVSLQCTQCHVNNVFKGTPTDCYSCHAAQDAHQGQFGQDCGACHSTTAWKPANFDHSKSNFPLTGAHVSVQCAQCHVNDVFKGTPTDCYSCHAANDAHQGKFGRDCGACHSTTAWKPADFDHSKTSFPLTGAHAGLACTQCHASGQFSGLSSNCVSCHADPAYHAGLFGTNCASCHNTSNWSASYNGQHPGGCDGNCINHEGATCRDCHTTTLSSATCTKCHDSNNPGGGGGGGGGD
jgi:hypothetical protein